MINLRKKLAEIKNFRGLNKTEKVPFPKPKKMLADIATHPGSTPDNGKLKEAYVAPSTNNNNYAQTLPATRKKIRNAGQGMSKGEMNDTKIAGGFVTSEDVITSLDQLNSLFEQYLNEKDPCWKGYKQIGIKKKNGKPVPNCVPVNELLQVGDKDEDTEIKKVRGSNVKPGSPGSGRVTRKYMGKVRGTTATGRTCNPIVPSSPVIGVKDGADWNRTIPSGEPKRK